MLTYPAFYILEKFIFSAIIFPVYFREHCATIPARNSKKFGEFLFCIKKDSANTPFYKVFN